MRDLKQELEDKIYNGNYLTEKELEDITQWVCKPIDIINDWYFDNDWQYIQSIFKIKDKLFAINWKRSWGLHVKKVS